MKSRPNDRFGFNLIICRLSGRGQRGWSRGRNVYILCFFRNSVRERPVWRLKYWPKADWSGKAKRSANCWKVCSVVSSMCWMSPTTKSSIISLGVCPPLWRICNPTLRPRKNLDYSSPKQKFLLSLQNGVALRG